MLIMFLSTRKSGKLEKQMTSDQNADTLFWVIYEYAELHTSQHKSPENSAGTIVRLDHLLSPSVSFVYPTTYPC